MSTISKIVRVATIANYKASIQKHIDAWFRVIGQRSLTAGMLVVSLSLTASVRAQTRPNILIDTNQMNVQEAQQANRLSGGDGSWLLTANSIDFTLPLLKSVVRELGSGIVITEDGSNGTNWVLNFAFSPRIALVDSTGKYVSARGGDGAGIFANIDDASKGPCETFAYFNSIVGPSISPAVPQFGQLLTDNADVFLQSFTGLWIKAVSGGGDFLVTSSSPPEYWTILRCKKISGGDSVIRPFDTIAIQTWNGIFDGGNFVAADVTVGGKLIANQPNATGAWQKFMVTYPNEYLTGSQIAPVTQPVVYTEVNDTKPKQLNGDWTRDWTLSGGLIDSVAARIGRGGIVVLTRTFQDVSEYPGVLPTHKQQVLDALGNKNCGGVVFEVTAGGDLNGGDILSGIDAVCRQRKTCFLLLPPRANSTNYSSDIKRSLAQLKRSRWYHRLNIVLACYDKKATRIGFIGGSNSVEGALQYCLRNR